MIIHITKMNKPMTYNMVWNLYNPTKKKKKSNLLVKQIPQIQFVYGMIKKLLRSNQ